MCHVDTYVNMGTIRIALLIFALSIVIAPLVSLSETIIPLVLIGVLIFFPGKESVPRLIRWMPYIWGLSFLESVFILIDYLCGSRLFPAEIYAVIKMNEVILALVFAPALIWSFYRNKSLLAWIVYMNAVISVFISIYNFTLTAGTVKPWIDLSASIATEAVLVAYFYKKLFLVKT